MIDANLFNIPIILLLLLLLSTVIAWIRYHVSFSLLRASVMSIRGARSSATKGPLHEPIELQATEGQLENA